MSHIIHGDSLDQLTNLYDGSVDLIVTDPPYGYSFMGKDWDRAVPSVDIWKECLRVLKPGAFCFVMSAPRSDVQMHMIQNLTAAGFRMDFTPIYWTYASGFPKAGNIGKLVDKRLGMEREVISTEHKTPPATNNYGNYGDDFEVKRTIASSDQAKALDGSYAGFQPKPAVEVILVAMKPLSEKTFVDQALMNGKGVTWLDDCRVPTEAGTDLNGGAYRHSDNDYDTAGNVYALGTKRQTGQYQQPTGRFPANLLVSDDVLNDGVERHARGNRSLETRKKINGIHGSVWNEGAIHGGGAGDSGSYSRYFDLDKWAQTLPFLIVPKASKGEKNRGLTYFTDKPAGSTDGNSGRSGQRTAGDGVTPIQPVYAKNHHPTVKPLKLMSYLITLASRKGDTILDPFCGSGTTCIAAQNLNRIGIGIEREAEYVEIARARLRYVMPQLPAEKPEPAVPPVTLDKLTQVSLF